jgi:hypothetical protein
MVKRLADDTKWGNAQLKEYNNFRIHKAVD